jgi:hypothetical protein
LTTAEIRVTGEEVQFVDRGSGELLHAIAAGPDYPVTRIVDQIRRNEGFVHPGGFVSRDDGATWSWVDFPWELPTTYVLAVPDGGFASFVVDYRWQENPAIAEFSVWTSNDGESWVDRGIPGFPMSAVRYVDLEASSADRLIATVVTDFDPQTGLEEGIAYVSTDALTWEALDIPVAPGSRAYRTNFGEVIASPLSSRRPFWVSVDGGSDWTPIDGPSSRPIEGYDVAGAAGDVMYVGFGAYPDGPRTLWIGTFGP